MKTSFFGGKVLKEKTRQKIENDQRKIYKEQKQYPEGKPGEQRDEKGRIIFTSIERALIPQFIQNRQNGLIRYPIVPQYPIQYASQEFPVDFGIPALKIAIEADGETFHSSEKQVTKDKERDAKLNQLGWTVLRFTDEEIENKMSQVMSSILQAIMKKERLIVSQQEQNSKE